MLEEKLAADAAAEEVIENEEGTQEEGAGRDDAAGEAERSPFQEELDRIEAEKSRLNEELTKTKAEKENIAKVKDKALADEKEKTKSVKESWKQEVMKEWEQKQALREANAKVKEVSADPTEQKVILHHFENLPDALKTGDTVEDLITARALANRKRLTSILNEEAMNDSANERSANSMGGSGLSGGSSFASKPSATARAASTLLSAYAGRDKDKAKKLVGRLR